MTIAENVDTYADDDADAGGYFRTNLVVISGHKVRNPELITSQNINNESLQRDVHRNMVICARVNSSGVYVVANNVLFMSLCVICMKELFDWYVIKSRLLGILVVFNFFIYLSRGLFYFVQMGSATIIP